LSTTIINILLRVVKFLFYFVKTFRYIYDMKHSNIIEAIGGTTRVASVFGLSTQNISNWKRRGIPWKYRFKILQRAKEMRVRLPDSFLEER